MTNLQKTTHDVNMRTVILRFKPIRSSTGNYFNPKTGTWSYIYEQITLIIHGEDLPKLIIKSGVFGK